MSVTDISHLPKSWQRKPEIRARSIAVIPLRNGTYVVEGSEYGYQFTSFGDGVFSRCECIAAKNGKECAHYIALKRFLKQRSPHERQGA